jgi:hypothetical protein
MKTEVRILTGALGILLFITIVLGSTKSSYHAPSLVVKAMQQSWSLPSALYYTRFSLFNVALRPAKALN